MTHKYLDTTGIILAGGESSRMGMNKALLRIDDKTSIQIILEKMKKIFENVLISANEPALYGTLQTQIIPDIITNHGPLSGVHAGLSVSLTEKVFFVPCDLPLMSARMIRYFLEHNTNAEIILPKIQNIPRYDFGIFNRSVITKIEREINGDDPNPSLRKLVKTGNTEYIEVEKLPFFDKNFFLNMNNPAEYEQVKLLFQIQSNDDEEKT
ncbi:MAG: molybdenum cofactor guanylyltransferase [Ignavibacteriaceae bacterium]|jgi:molybdopterin-guanine dinucleotide biosynthesis protein A|nr:molybdenum cofactor guanylyltransferase [Ignavibacteriaceae bacterium]